MSAESLGQRSRWGEIARLAVALCAVTGLVGSASAAAADPGSPRVAGKRLVVMGDSFTANGIILNGAVKDCPHGPASWPVQLSGLLGATQTQDLVDVSCSGAAIRSEVSYNILHEARAADAAGAFGPRTEVVAIQLGMNDAWGSSATYMLGAMAQCVFNLHKGCDLDAAPEGRIPDFREVTGEEYADRIRGVVDYVHYFAPTARIVLVGYPELIPRDSTVLCTNILGFASFVQNRGRAVVEYLNRLDQAQREAADILKVSYFDTRSVTAGHGLCSAEPWINGFLDPRADLIGVPLHPTARGDEAVASAMSRWLAQ
jgi:lysophospholipase L1-like esterase